MNKQQLLQGCLGFGLVFTSCGNHKQIASSDGIPDRIVIPVEQVTVSEETNSGPEVRNVKIPLIQLEATSVYRQMLVYADLDELVARVYSSPKTLSIEELLQVASLYRPGTEQYREVYELAAYRFSDCRVAQLNAMASSLAMGDREAARYFL
ncbi:hypothetical protein [Parabacteroides timonensis]|uniref:hypothetical protein n=1 Tax=Parabacteroides timonensis TaxID=1871013 RepID=UPI00094F2AF1|nr:hypothetical protein [Parabacteroides timonensis]